MDQVLRLVIEGDARGAVAAAKVSERALTQVSRTVQQTTQQIEAFATRNRRAMSSVSEASGDATQSVTRLSRTGSGALGHLSQALDHVAGRAAHFNRSAAELEGKFQDIYQAAQNFGGLGSVMRIVSGGASLLTGPLKVIVSLGSAVVGTLGQITGAVLNLAGAMGERLLGVAQQTFSYLATGATAAAAGLAAALGLVGKQGVDMNLTLQGAKAALTQLLGSSDAAGKFLGELKDEAAKSIPTLKDLLPIATQLVQAYGPAGLGKVLPTIRAFGDAASIAAGGDTNRMSLALLGFRQMLGRDFAQQEELNQVGENLGVNTNNLLKGAFGTSSTDELKERGITAAMVGDAIVKGLQQQFGGAQARAANTLPGRTSNIQDAINARSGQVTEGLTDRLTTAAGNILDFLNGLDKTAAGSRILQLLTDGFNAAGNAAIFLTQQLPAASEWLVKVLDSQPFQEFQKVAQTVFAAVTQTITGAVQWIGKHWGEGWETVKKLTSGAVEIVGGIISGFGAVVQDLAQGGGQDLRTFAKNFQEFAATTVVALGRVISTVARLGQVWAASNAFNPLILGMGIKPMQMFETANMLGGIADTAPALGDQAAGAIRGQKPLFDMGEMTQRKDSLGVFSRGYQSFGERWRKEGMAAIFGPNVGGGPNPFAAAPNGDLTAMFQALGIPVPGAAPAAVSAAPGPVPGAPLAHNFPQAFRAPIPRPFPQVTPPKPLMLNPPEGGFPAGLSPASSFGPVTLPDGRVVSAWAAQQLGYLPETPGAAPVLPEAGMGAPAEMSGGGSRPPINFSPTFNLHTLRPQDLRENSDLVYALTELFRRWLNEQVRGVYSGVSP